MVVFSIIYSRVSWWAFSLQKQMCIEQSYACFLLKKCKSKHLEQAVRLFTDSKNTWGVLFLGVGLRSSLFTYYYMIILYHPNMHTCSSSSHHSTVSVFCMCYFILPCISTTSPPVPSGGHFSSVDPTIPQSCTWAAHTIPKLVAVPV